MSWPGRMGEPGIVCRNRLGREARRCSPVSIAECMSSSAALGFDARAVSIAEYMSASAALGFDAGGGVGAVLGGGSRKEEEKEEAGVCRGVDCSESSLRLE